MTNKFDEALKTMSDQSDWVEENWNTIEEALTIASGLQPKHINACRTLEFDHNIVYTTPDGEVYAYDLSALPKPEGEK